MIKDLHIMVDPQCIFRVFAHTVQALGDSEMDELDWARIEQARRAADELWSKKQKREMERGRHV